MSPRRRLLSVRPEAEAERTAAAAARAGWEMVSAPLLEIAPAPWRPPEGSFDALLLTSAQAVRQAGPLPAAIAALPVVAVGAATAQAARAAGLRVVTEGDTDGSAAIARARAAGLARLLHLGGADRAPLTVPGDVHVESCAVYRARAVGRLPDEAVRELGAGTIFATLLMSPRSAALFAKLADAAGVARGAQRLVGISAAAAAAAGAGWRDVAVAARPTLAAVLAATSRMWQEGKDG